MILDHCGNTIKGIPALNESIASLCISSDGLFISVCGSDGSLALLDLAKVEKTIYEPATVRFTASTLNLSASTSSTGNAYGSLVAAGDEAGDILLVCDEPPHRQRKRFNNSGREGNHIHVGNAFNSKILSLSWVADTVVAVTGLGVSFFDIGDGGAWSTLSLPFPFQKSCPVTMLWVKNTDNQPQMQPSTLLIANASNILCIEYSPPLVSAPCPRPRGSWSLGKVITMTNRDIKGLNTIDAGGGGGGGGVSEKHFTVGVITTSGDGVATSVLDIHKGAIVPDSEYFYELESLRNTVTCSSITHAPPPLPQSAAPQSPIVAYICINDKLVKVARRSAKEMYTLHMAEGRYLKALACAVDSGGDASSPDVDAAVDAVLHLYLRGGVGSNGGDGNSEEKQVGDISGFCSKYLGSRSSRWVAWLPSFVSHGKAASLTSSLLTLQDRRVVVPLSVYKDCLQQIEEKEEHIDRGICHSLHPLYCLTMQYEKLVGALLRGRSSVLFHYLSQYKLYSYVSSKVMDMIDIDAALAIQAVAHNDDYFPEMEVLSQLSSVPNYQLDYLHELWQHITTMYNHERYAKLHNLHCTLYLKYNICQLESFLRFSTRYNADFVLEALEGGREQEGEGREQEGERCIIYSRLRAHLLARMGRVQECLVTLVEDLGDVEGAVDTLCKGGGSSDGGSGSSSGSNSENDLWAYIIEIVRRDKGHHLKFISLYRKVLPHVPASLLLDTFPAGAKAGEVKGIVEDLLRFQQQEVSRLTVARTLSKAGFAALEGRLNYGRKGGGVLISHPTTRTASTDPTRHMECHKCGGVINSAARRRSEGKVYNTLSVAFFCGHSFHGSCVGEGGYRGDCGGSGGGKCPICL